MKEQAPSLLPPLIKLVLPVGEIGVVETGNDDAESDNCVEVALLTEGRRKYRGMKSTNRMRVVMMLRRRRF